MLNTKSISLVCLVSLTFGTFSFGQVQGGGHYNGPRPSDIDVLNQRPVFSTGCGQLYQTPNLKPLLDACILGGSTGMKVAERYATSEGRMDGYKRGYAWGLRASIDATRNDHDIVNAGHAGMNSSDPSTFLKLAIADQAGGSAGVTAGSANGDQEAVGRFHAAVDKGVFPSQTVAAQDYAKYDPQYRSPYSRPYEQTVRMPDSEETLLNGPQIQYSGIHFSQIFDNGMYGDTPNFNGHDYYRQDGIYGVNASEARDANRAFQVFLNRQAFDRSGYSQLGQVTIITGYTHPTPASGPAPAQPAPGTPVATTPVTPTEVVTPQPQAITQVFDQKKIFEKAFIESYQKVVPFYYNNAFYAVTDQGFNEGQYIGRQVGQRLAYQRGLIEAYDTQFRVRESNQFWESYRGAFNSSFATRYQDYATHPQVGVDKFTIIGAKPDGIIEPGEGILASFTLKNYGGVGADLNINLEGDVSNSKTIQVKLKPLSSNHQQGSITAAISDKVQSGSNAEVVLNVNGKHYPLTQYVIRQVTLASATYTADMPHGTVQATIDLKNNSTVKSYDLLKLVVSDSLGRTKPQVLGFLEAGQVLPTVLNLTGYDPLDLIDGKVNVTVQAYMGSVNIGSTTMVISTTHRYAELAKLFEVAATGSDDLLKTRVSDVIFAEIKGEAEARDGGKYDDSHPSFLKTLVSTKGSHSPSVQLNSAWSSLADRLLAGRFKFNRRGVHVWGTQAQNEKWFMTQISALKR